MKLNGALTVNAPQEEVWQLFMDPVQLCRVIPGCEQARQLDETHYEAVLAVKVQFMTIRSKACGTIVGLTRGTTRAHLVRATLEGIAFRTRDVLEAMTQDTGSSIRSIKVDGGVSANAFLMQSLADISGVEVRVAAIRETTSLGVAFLAGLGIGLWKDQAEIAALWHEAASYSPRRNANVEIQYQQWLRAVERARGWATPVSAKE